MRSWSPSCWPRTRPHRTVSSGWRRWPSDSCSAAPGGPVHAMLCCSPGSRHKLYRSLVIQGPLGPKPPVLGGEEHLVVLDPGTADLLGVDSGRRRRSWRRRRPRPGHNERAALVGLLHCYGCRHPTGTITIPAYCLTVSSPCRAQATTTLLALCSRFLRPTELLVSKSKYTVCMSASLADPQATAGRPAADEELASRLRVAVTRLNLTGP